MERVHHIGDGIWLLDSYMADMQEFTAAYALRGGEGAALVDSGVSLSVPAVLEGLEEAGIAAEEVRYVIITHIHLDHAGGAGYLLRDHLPEARVVVAEKGLQILARPERLVASARRSLGSLARMYGDMVPIAGERILSAEEVGALELGGRVLRLVPAPGHASTHQCVVDESSGTLFCGDALGMYLAGEGKVIPITPPPDFNLEDERRTLERLGGLACGRTCFSHFGCGGACDDLARESLHNLELMVEKVREGLHKGEDPKHIAGELIRIMDVNSRYGRFMFGGMSLVNVHGIKRYLG